MFIKTLSILLIILINLGFDILFQNIIQFEFSLSYRFTWYFNLITDKETRRFFKNPEIIDGFEVFDVYMNKKKEDLIKRRRTVSFVLLLRDFDYIFNLV